MDAFFNTIGLIGTVLLLGAFFLQQRGTIAATGEQYLWMNLIGSVAIVISLLRFWNLSAFLLDLAWALISAYGIFKRRRKFEK